MRAEAIRREVNPGAVDAEQENLFLGTSVLADISGELAVGSGRVTPIVVVPAEPLQICRFVRPTSQDSDVCLCPP